jgi:hypothetical protein
MVLKWGKWRGIAWFNLQQQLLLNPALFKTLGGLSRHLEHYFVSTAYGPGLAHRLTIGTPIAIGGLHDGDHGASDQDETAAFADTDT